MLFSGVFILWPCLLTNNLTHNLVKENYFEIIVLYLPCIPAFQLGSVFCMFKSRVMLKKKWIELGYAE